LIRKVDVFCQHRPYHSPHTTLFISPWRIAGTTAIDKVWTIRYDNEIIGKVLSNDRIKIGIRRDAALHFDNVGLAYIYPGSGAISQTLNIETPWESWGASADSDVAVASSATSDDPYQGTFTSLDDSVEGEAFVTTETVDGTMRVHHRFRPSSVSENLYEVDIRLENISGSTINVVKYRRVAGFGVATTVS